MCDIQQPLKFSPLRKLILSSFAVCIITLIKPLLILSSENNLFISGKDSDSVGSKESGTPAPTRQPPSGAGFGGGGLFEDNDDDDDFFGGKSTRTSGSGECG